MSKTKNMVEVHFVLDEDKARALAKMVRRLNHIDFCEQIADDESEAQDMQKAADLIVSVLEEGGIT